MSALRNWRIRNIALILMISSGLAMAALAAIMDYQVHRKLMLKGIDDRLYDAAIFAKEMLPPDFHDQITDRHSLSPNEFDQIVEHNNRLCEKLDLKYIWSLMLVDGQPVFTSSTSTDKKISTGNYARFFEKHSDPQLYAETFETMKPCFQAQHDKWGSIRVALIPYVDAHGRKYLFGSSMELSAIETYFSSLWRYSLIVMSMLIIPAAFVTIYVSRRLSTPISTLADTATAIAAGDYSQPVTVSGSKEINVVAKQMETMRNSVKRHVNNLQASMQELEDLRATVDASPVLVYQARANPQSTPVYLSANYASLGYPLEDLCSGKIKWEQIVPEDDLQRVRKLADRAVDKGEDSFSAEIRFIRASGETVRYQSWNQILRNKNGVPEFIRGILTDITEQTLTQNRLQDLYRVVIGSDVHIYRVKADHDLTTEFVTDNYADMGYAPEDLLSGKIKWKDIIHPEDVKQGEKVLTEELRKGSESYVIESRLFWANGEIHWYRCWNKFIRDDSGTPISIQGIMMDITSLKNAHAETLKHQQILKETIRDLDQFYQLITVSPVIAFRIKIAENLPTVMLTSNIESTGYTASEFLNGDRLWTDLIPRKDFLLLENEILEHAEKGIDNYQVEFRMKWKDGGIHWYHSWHNILRDKNGKATHVQGLISEITELKEAHSKGLTYQQRLKELALELVKAEDKERQDIAYILHDDIGQMLAGLNMKLSVLQEVSDEDHKRDLNNQVNELLGRIMKTTKSLTWEISPTSLYETDIAAGLDRMASDLQNFFDLDIKIETAGARIELDRDTSALIFRMAKELLVNIAKHSGTQTAEIGISRYNNKVHMVVSDPGTGFDPEKISNGKGYGLFSIRERLEHINGSIHIDSVPGEGTRILMIIPMDISALN